MRGTLIDPRPSALPSSHPPASAMRRLRMSPLPFAIVPTAFLGMDTANVNGAASRGRTSVAADVVVPAEKALLVGSSDAVVAHIISSGRRDVVILPASSACRKGRARCEVASGHGPRASCQLSSTFVISLKQKILHSLFAELVEPVGYARKLRRPTYNYVHAHAHQATPATATALSPRAPTHF